MQKVTWQGAPLPASVESLCPCGFEENHAEVVERRRWPGVDVDRVRAGARRVAFPPGSLPQHLCADRLGPGVDQQCHCAHRHRRAPGQRRCAAARRPHRGGGYRPDGTGRCGACRWPGQVGHSGHHRCALAPGRVSQPGRQRAQRRQRDDCPGHRQRLGRALGVAAGSGLRCGTGRRRDLDAGIARLGQPGRRPRRDLEERTRDDLPVHEVPRCAVGPEDGLRRKPQACLRWQGHRPGHAHGQCRRLPCSLHRCQRVHRQEHPETAEEEALVQR